MYRVEEFNHMVTVVANALQILWRQALRMLMIRKKEDFKVKRKEGQRYSQSDKESQWFRCTEAGSKERIELQEFGTYKHTDNENKIETDREIHPKAARQSF